jgi:peroxiredoxin
MGNAALERKSQFPGERDLLRPFVLPDDRGRKVDIEKFRGERNLVLFVVKDLDPETETLLGELAAAAEELAAAEAVVVPVIRGGVEEAATLRKRLRLPFAVLAGAGGEVVASLCGNGASVYVADRFREVFTVRHGGRLLSRDEILEWLAHINRQCPE